MDSKTRRPQKNQATKWEVDHTNLPLNSYLLSDQPCLVALNLDFARCRDSAGEQVDQPIFAAA